MTSQPIVLDPTGSDIQAEIDRLRAQGPATPVELPGGIRAWSITDTALLERLLVSPQVSKDPRQHWPAFAGGEITPDWSLYLWVAVNNMFTAYGADHRRLRRLVAPAFTARRTDALRPRIEEIAAEILDELAATPAGTVVDLRDEFCYQVPVRVIFELMGVPAELGTGMRACFDAAFDTTITPEDAQANYLELYRFLGELVAYKRATPGDDMTSLLIASRDDDGEGAPLSEPELIDTLLLVISAGHETTINLLDQTITALLTHPDELAKVTAGKVSWTDAIEEALRFESAVVHVPLRYAVTEIEVAPGVVIAPGDPILVCYAATGRDPRTHPGDAAVFDVSRADKAHMAFGYGVHHCLGAPLARAEAGIALPALFARFPRLRLAVPAKELEPLPSFISNGHRALPVHLT
ncbi:cytochrome P450 family protein [Nocardia stercoris]|uniref:Cytochrome P450 n=1 Tax=Nocardia stercoris TaxID=2483361 RepID=A0A3M2LHC7_9NOCA|nr:cytochrome P450 [Nocardia stercoris]RMI35415.1 cytochrome P450 [Nocardia stercoris]